jgi:hypothetical protein
MTAHITYRLGGFTATGLSPWNKDLSKLANAIGAHSVAWADLDQTSLFVTCERPQAAAFRLCDILQAHGVADWRQTVHVVNLDETMTAFVFSHSLPGGSIGEFFNHSGACDLVIGGRTMILMRADDANDAIWRGAIEAAWEILRKREVPLNDGDVPYYQLPKAVGRGTVIELDETIIAVRVHDTQALNVNQLKNHGVNFAHVGSHAVLLGAGERPAPTTEHPHRIERPTLFEFALGLARSMHVLFTTRNCLGFEPKPVEVTIR